MTLGSDWLDRVELSGEFSTHSLRRGSEYARYDWQLEVDIEPGVASMIARSGRRMTYQASAQVPTVNETVWDDLVERLAASTVSTAALLDGELPEGVAEQFLPEPAQVAITCSCHSNDSPCKHAAAVIFLLAEAIDEDPFELLHLRGLSRSQLIDRVTKVRRGPSEEDTDDPDRDPDGGNGDGSNHQGLSVDNGGLPSGSLPSGSLQAGSLQWSGSEAPLPDDHALPDLPGRLPPFASDPPSSAGFTSNGLQTLANDAAHRALALLQDGTVVAHRIHATADLARRASLERGTPGWKHLVQQSGVSSQELTARSRAWDVAGEVGVDAHVAPVEIKRMVDTTTGEAVQWRRTGAGSWVRFAKSNGRWEAVAPPSSDPDLTTYDDSV